MKKTIQNVGKINYISNLKDGQGTRIANDFLSILVKEFAKQSSLYMRETFEAPFVFKERQLHSILAPALSKITNSFLMESPIKREWSLVSNEEHNDSHGWVDYWCRYRDVVFFIELKHNFISKKTCKITKSIKENWNIALKQLDAIEKEAKVYGENCKGTFRMVLHVLPIYERVKEDINQYSTNVEEIINLQKLSMNELDKKPNWSAMWEIRDNLTGPYRYINGVECYPGVLFLCNLSEIL